jgi:hypothetical protein
MGNLGLSPETVKAASVAPTVPQHNTDLESSPLNNSTTTASSPKLAEKFKDSGSRLCVGSFHGHAHAQKCQIDWHPLYVTGSGLEDFETCEHLFSGSNALARCTRLATVYNRKELISRFMSFWNHDKYTELSL